MSHPQKRFPKPALRAQSLLQHLQARGLTIHNQAEAIVALQTIGYYRLLIYMRSIQDPRTSRFLAGSTFQNVLDLYNFDRQLRLLCLDAIEKIEVALRASIIENVAAHANYGPHFYTQSRHFEQANGFLEFMKKSTSAHYLGISHYRNKYNDPSLPPIWTILEATTFGTLSQMYSTLHLRNRKLVEQTFHYDETILVSWFRSINNLRNMCAHHNRIWNCDMKPDQPKKANALSAVWGSSQDKFYARAVVICALLERIDPTTDWKHRLALLMAKYPNAQSSQMGFPANWKNMPFWT